MLPAPAPTATRLSPSDFSSRLLAAVEADSQRDPRDRDQHAVLLRPFVGANLDGGTFEAALHEYRTRHADLSQTARDVWVLWRLCNAQ
jgi:hypothetical protein